MIIREANKYDLPYFIELIKKLALSEHIMRYNYGELDDEHLNTIFSTIIALNFFDLKSPITKFLNLCNKIFSNFDNI